MEILDFKDFTVILDEYVVLDPEDGFCFFWSKSEFEATLFLRLINRFALLFCMYNVSQC